MIISAVIRELMAAGVTGDALVTAVERIEAANKPEKSAGAKRTQKWRERHSDVTASQASHVTLQDRKQRHSDVTSVTCDAGHIYNSPNIKESKKGSIYLSENWSPSEADFSFALSKGWTSERVISEGQRFRDHFLSKGKRFRNVSAGWRNWVTSPYQKQDQKNGKRGVMEAADDLLDKLRAFDAPAPSDFCNGAG